MVCGCAWATARCCAWRSSASIAARCSPCSGGEAQRVALARALAFEPAIVLLDEPFTALDQPTRESLVGEAMRELRRLGATTLFVTHDRTEAITLADRVIVLVDGRLRQVDRPDELLARPADATIAAYVGAAP